MAETSGVRLLNLPGPGVDRELLDRIVSERTICEAFGVSEATLRTVSGDGRIEKVAPARYRLGTVIKGFADYLREERKTKTAAAGDSRWREERANDLQMRVEERKKTHLIEAQEEALGIIDEYAGELRSDLLSMAARLTDDLALRRKIEDNVNEAFGNAATRASNTADRVDAARYSLGAAGGHKSGQLGAAKSSLSGEPRSTGAARA